MINKKHNTIESLAAGFNDDDFVNEIWTNSTSQVQNEVTMKTNDDVEIPNDDDGDIVVDDIGQPQCHKWFFFFLFHKVFFVFCTLMRLWLVNVTNVTDHNVT